MTVPTRRPAAPMPVLSAWAIGGAVVGAALVSWLGPAVGFGLRLTLWAWMTVAIAIGIIDAKEHRIPNRFVAVLSALTVVYLVAASAIATVPASAAWWAMAAGLAAGLAALVLLIVSGGAIGMGDVKLLVPTVTLLSMSGVGAVRDAFVWTVLFAGGYVGLRLALGRGSDPIPLAPFLVLGVGISLVLLQQ